MDKADRIILGLIQENAALSLDFLANATELSVASVQRRLKRLRETKVIEREITVLNPKALGQDMTFIVMVELERERSHQIEMFRRAVVADPQVQQCYYVTGDADFTLICVARDMDDFEQLTHRLFFDNENIRRFRTSVVMGRKKVGLSVPTCDPSVTE